MSEPKDSILVQETEPVHDLVGERTRARQSIPLVRVTHTTDFDPHAVHILRIPVDELDIHRESRDGQVPFYGIFQTPNLGRVSPIA